MKKFLLFSSFFLLASCGNQTNKIDSVQSSSEVAEESSAISESIVESIPDEKDNLEITDGTPMTIVGQWKQDEYFGKMTLEKIANIDQKFELAPGIDASIVDIKLFKIEDFASNFKNDIERLGFVNDDTLYSLQIAPVFENSNNYDVQAISFDRLIDSEGFQNDTNLNSYLVNDLAANAKTNKIISHFILSNGDITEFTIFTKHLTGEGYLIESNGVTLSF